MSLVKDNKQIKPKQTMQPTITRSVRQELKDRRVEHFNTMPTAWLLARISYRHRVGLLMLSTICMATYIVWDKI